MRAATYIQERLTRRSPACNEIICRTPKVPPDKMAESGSSRRQVLNVVSEKEKASISVRLPESMVESAAASSRLRSEAVLPQLHGKTETPPKQSETPRANELSTECSESVSSYAEPMRDASSVSVRLGCSAWPVVAAETDRHSFERLVETEEVSEELVPPALIEGVWPSIARGQSTSLVVGEVETSAHSHSRVPSVALTPFAPLPVTLLQALTLGQLSAELIWFHLKPPDNGCTRPRSYNAVSLSFAAPNTGKHSLEYEMDSLPVSKPDCAWADPASRPPTRLEPVWWERVKPPNTATYVEFLYETVSTLSERTGLAAHRSWPLTLWDMISLRRLPCPSSPWRVPRVVGLGRRTCGIRLLVAVFGQRN